MCSKNATLWHFCEYSCYICGQLLDVFLSYISTTMVVGGVIRRQLIPQVKFGKLMCFLQLGETFLGLYCNCYFNFYTTRQWYESIGYINNVNVQLVVWTKEPFWNYVNHIATIEQLGGN